MVQLTKYRRYNIFYENGLFIGKRDDKVFENISEAELKHKIDLQLLKVEQKRINLGEYKGFILFYEGERFGAQKGNYYMIYQLSELLIKKFIDDFLVKNEDEQATCYNDTTKTTIQISKETLFKLQAIKIIQRESYDNIISRMISKLPKKDETQQNNL